MPHYTSLGCAGVVNLVLRFLGRRMSKVNMQEILSDFVLEAFIQLHSLVWFIDQHVHKW